MRRTEALPSVRMIRFRDISGRFESNESNHIEAAELLGVNERAFRFSKASDKRLSMEREQRVESLYRTSSSGVTVRHFHDLQVLNHGLNWRRPWAKAFPLGEIRQPVSPSVPTPDTLSCCASKVVGATR